MSDAEVSALKTELEECIKRRFGDDPHRDSLAIAVSATAITLSNLIRAAGQDEDHRHRLRTIVHMMMQQTT
jgi:hypothetical protein